MIGAFATASAAQAVTSGLSKARSTCPTDHFANGQQQLQSDTNMAAFSTMICIASWDT